MPLYDYRCTACGHEVEIMHPVHGLGPDACERCGGKMRKALSTPAIHFKGSGWAKKDARSASAGASTASRGPGAGADSTGTDPGGQGGKAAASSGSGDRSDAPKAAGTAGGETTGSGSG